MKTRKLRFWAVGTALICASTAVWAQPAVDAQQLRNEILELERKFERLQIEHKQQIDALQKKLDQLQSQSAIPAPAAAAPQAAPQAAPEPAVTAETARPSASPFRLGNQNAYMDVGLVGTFAAGTSTASDIAEGTQPGGHDPNQRGFTVQGVEASFTGAVDPYFRGVANVLFGLDAGGESFIEMEEAWLETTTLPANLQLRAGQLMTEFGRHNPLHPHSWAFVDTPLAVARFLGPDGLRNPGARIAWLAPTPFYSELLLTVQNSHGETVSPFRSSGHVHGPEEEEEELPFAYRHPDNDRGLRNLDDLLFTPRYVASLDLTDNQVLMLGLSGAFGPNSSGGGGDTQTRIYGTDITWKWKSPNHHAGFPFVSFQAEALLREYEAGEFDWAEEPDGLIDLVTDAPAFLPEETLIDYGFYAQILYGFRKGWVAGLRFDFVDGDTAGYERRALAFGDELVGGDPARAERWRISPNLTWFPSEFSKIRLQYNLDHRRHLGEDHSIWLQFEFLLGAHAAHTF